MQPVLSSIFLLSTVIPALSSSCPWALLPCYILYCSSVIVSWVLENTVLFLWKDVYCACYDTSGNPLPSPLTADYMDQILKGKKVQYYSIIHLMPCLHSYYYPMFFTHSRNFSIFCFLCHSHCLRLCLSRASIVQKRVIYFQDEGSLTIRLCEKGNDSCPSSPHLRCQLLIFSSLATHHSAIVPITFPISPLEAEQFSHFHTVFKKSMKWAEAGVGNHENSPSQLSW